MKQFHLCVCKSLNSLPKAFCNTTLETIIPIIDTNKEFPPSPIHRTLVHILCIDSSPSKSEIKWPCFLHSRIIILLACLLHQESIW